VVAAHTHSVGNVAGVEAAAGDCWRETSIFDTQGRRRGASLEVLVHLKDVLELDVGEGEASERTLQACSRP